MYPVLFHIGGRAIYSYTLLLDLGLLLGLGLTYREGQRLGLDMTALDAALLAVVGGLLGGRAGYVLAYREYFAAHPGQVLALWRGGLSFGGAFLAGLLTTMAYAALRRRPLGELLDALTPGLALGLVCGWLGCLLAGCAYGQPVDPAAGCPAWLCRDLPDLYGVSDLRYATQAIAAVWSAVTFTVVWIARRRRPFPAFIFLLWLLLYAGGLVFIEGTRGDETLYLGSRRLMQMVAALAAAVSSLLLLVLGVIRLMKKRNR